MATMVITPPQISLPTSNGYSVQEAEAMGPGDGDRIDISGLQQQEPDDEAYTQVVPNSHLDCYSVVLDLASH